MKKYLFVILGAAALVACNRPRNIPDQKLVDITHDLFLANAFRATGGGISLTDTVDLYTPIFKKYGYKPADFGYTIANFSKRKSVRFTDILDTVVARIQSEDARLGREIAMIDTADQRLLARYGRVIYTDPRAPRRLTRLSAVDQPDITIPIREGQLSIEYVFDLDSTSPNDELRFAYNTADESGKKRGQYDYLIYSKRTRRRDKVSLMVLDTAMKKLQIVLADSPNTTQKSIKLKIDSLQVSYQPTLGAARDSLAREILYQSRAQFLVPHALHLPQTLGPLRADTSRVVAPRDTLVRR